jgi:hypothetical protein
MMSDPTEHEDYVHPLARLFLWTDSARVRDIAMWLLGAVSIGLGLLDWPLHRHDYLDFASNYGFYGWMGFGSFVLAVQGGRLLRGVISRPEDSYDGAAGDD